jgi:hypothetical protein
VSRLRAFRFPALLLVAYGWLFAWFPSLRSPNELSRLAQTRALVVDHSLAIDADVARRGPVGDIAAKDGRHYAAKAPGVSLAGVPVYAALALLRGGDERVTERAGVFFLRLFACALPGVAAAELLRRILARTFAPPLALAGATVFALGTIMWPYSTQLVGHGPTAAALVASWWALDARRDSDRARWPLLAGLAAGGAVLLEYTSALLLPALAGFGLASAGRRGRAALLAAIGALPPMGALALFQWAALGSPLSTPYDFMANPVYVQWHARGFMGLGAPDLRVFAASFVDPAKGLFAYSPFLALGVPGLAWLWRRDRATAGLCAAAAGLYGIFTAGFSFPAWGWSIGPRHLTGLCAFLVPPALALAEDLRGRGLGFVPAALAVCSMAVVAAVCAVCPYFPSELTNPFAQLVLPLARAGAHVGDVLGMATGVRSVWTLVPWAAAVHFLGTAAAGTLAGGEGTRGRIAQLALATAAAAALVLGLAVVRVPDGFDGTRAFMLARYEPRGEHVPGLFAPP